MNPPNCARVNFYNKNACSFKLFKAQANRHDIIKGYG